MKHKQHCYFVRFHNTASIFLTFALPFNHTTEYNYHHTRWSVITTITSFITTTDHLVWITDYNASTHYIAPDHTWTGGPRTISCRHWSTEGKCQIAAQLVANGWAHMWAICAYESPLLPYISNVCCYVPKNPQIIVVQWVSAIWGGSDISKHSNASVFRVTELFHLHSDVIPRPPTSNKLKVGPTAHVSFPSSVYPYLYTKHTARLVIWKLCNNNQVCAYANRFPISTEDVLVFIPRSCITCRNMALRWGGGGDG